LIFGKNLNVEKYSDKSIIAGIKNRKDATLQYLYKEYYPQVQRIVNKHGGEEQDARDLFQEALIIIFNKLNSNNLVIKTSFHNYFIVLCRFIWFRQNNISLDHKADDETTGKSQATDNLLPGADDDPGESVLREYRENQYEKIYQRHYRKLGRDCKKVLKSFFKKKSFREIAARMNYANEEYARRKKYLCMQQLMKMVSTDPEFVELKKNGAVTVE
jgi:RNA polymerase sigma factor (sigma-70 family)